MRTLLKALAMHYLALALLAQSPPGVDMKAWFETWRGASEPIPVDEMIARFEREKDGLVDGKSYPTVTVPQVLAAAAHFAKDNPDSEFTPSLMEAITSRKLPKGTLLYFSSDTETLPCKGGTFEIKYFQVDLFVGLHLDKSPLQVDGKWRSMVVAKFPVAIQEK